MNGIFDLTETSYVETVWFVAWPGADWMAIVYRDTKDGPWRATFRWHYMAGVDRDDCGTKSAYEHTGADTSEAKRRKLVEVYDTIANVICATKKGKKWRVNVQGDQDRFLKLMSQQEWMHIKVLPPDPERTM